LLFAQPIRRGMHLLRRLRGSMSRVRIPHRMVRHILLLQPRSDASLEEIDACRVGLVRLVGRIPGLLNCHWGENLAPAERREGLIYGFTMDFQRIASCRTWASTMR
jgi:hypothetical protein